MQINSDYRDLLQCFVEEEVQFLVVGGYAVIKYMEPYHTKDLDLWIAPNRDNAERAYAALGKFGAPVKGITVDDLLNPDLIYQVGVEPVRLDVMSAVPGLEFANAWEHHDWLDYGGVKVAVLSIEDTSQAKKAAGRPKDLAQAAELDEIIARRRGEKDTPGCY